MAVPSGYIVGISISKTIEHLQFSFKHNAFVLSRDGAAMVQTALLPMVKMISPDTPWIIFCYQLLLDLIRRKIQDCRCNIQLPLHR